MRLCGYALCLVFLWVAHSRAETPHVLLLNSYHPQYAWTDQLTKGVVAALASDVDPENIHVEFMDARRFVDEPAYFNYFSDLLTYKYRHYRPDVIITSDDHAYHFILNHRAKLFPEVPVVFSGVNVFDPELLADQKNITGILEGMEIEGNLDLIQHIQPNIKRIIMLGDTTGLGLRMVNEAKRIQSEWRTPTVSLEIWDRFTLNELYEQAASLPPNTAILMLAIHKDSLGAYFSFERELKMLSQRSSAPIYGMWGGLMIGNGVVGGMMNDPYRHGANAAQMALEILHGKAASDMPIVQKASYSAAFDYNQYQRFHLRESYIPPGSSVSNLPSSLYRQYHWQINSIVSFILVLVIVIYYLIKNVRDRAVIQKDLDHLNQHLEAKVQSRTRELHLRNQQLENARLRMEEIAHTDALTGLGNRRAGQAEVTAFYQRSLKDGEPLTIAIVDIDYFKRINDEYGHQVGDMVLLEFSKVVKDAIRPSDRLYRWGGEEFLLVLPNTERKFACAVCNRIIQHLHQHKFDEVGVITASIGVASLQSNEPIEELFRTADERLYMAKDNGRDQVMVG